MDIQVAMSMHYHINTVISESWKIPALQTKELETECHKMKLQTSTLTV